MKSEKHWEKRYPRIKFFTIKRQFLTAKLRKLGFTYSAIGRWMEVSITRIQQYEADYLMEFTEIEKREYLEKTRSIKRNEKIFAKQIKWKIKPFTKEEIIKSLPMV